MSYHKKPEPIAKILEGTLKTLHLDERIKKYSVWNHWEEIVGKNIAEKAHPGYLQDETLVVKVVSHPWMTELSLMKNIILEKIQKRIEGCQIRNLRFELADTPKKIKNKN